MKSSHLTALRLSLPPRTPLARALCGSIAISALLTAGCASQFDPGTTLADLPAATLPPEPAVEIPPIDLAGLARSYENALASNSDPATRRQILLRLADIEMERLEQQQEDSPETAVAYASAVRRYEALLAESTADDYLHYRLARARSLDGNNPGALNAMESIIQNAPDSPFIAEALFRRGEAQFSRKNYRAAEQDFTAVLAEGETPFARNARYMLGWSQFKDARYRDAGYTFLTLLDEMFAESPLEQLEKGPRRLADDTLRVLALDFNYLGGAEVIESFNRDGAPRPYQHLLYRALGDWYAESERYQDGAQVFLSYVESNPQSPQAPAMHVRAVEILQQGNFPSEARPTKLEFVRRYGTRSLYWQSAEAPLREEIATHLKPWLEELARFDHARAQAFAKEAANRKTSARNRQRAEREARNAFLAAADLYREFGESFSEDAKVPELTFLMAECFNEAGESKPAFEAYRTVAWGYENTPLAAHNRHATEAGYAAILMTEKIRNAQQDLEQARLWLDRKIETGLHFAESWPKDARALPVQLDAADSLFRQRRYPEAIAAAQTAAGWQQPVPSRQQQRTILLILGHSQFAMEDYAGAESAYTQLLAGMNSEDPQYLSTRDRLQSSIYKQAEVLLQQPAIEDNALAYVAPTEKAIALLLRVRDTGRSQIAATAQYDAINSLIRLQRWPQAQQEIADFRKFYPQHQLTSSLTAKAVVVYEGLDMPGAMAGELLGLANSDPDPVVRRGSLYLAAEQFHKSGDQGRALATYRQYVRDWPQPALQNLEARYQLVKLYEATGNRREQNMWLQSLAGNKVDEPRGRYLAAYGQNALAEQSYAQFSRLRLSLPLKQSLQAKKQAMDTAVADYRKVLDFGIAEFTTAANFRLAEVYRQLSRDLMDSERPGGLNALELEQYEILLEEQAFPFEEKAIELHEANVARTVEGVYDQWVKESFSSLENLLPARYRKPETTVEWSDAAY